jgi:hypothetical protein
MNNFDLEHKFFLNLGFFGFKDVFSESGLMVLIACTLLFLIVALISLFIFSNIKLFNSFSLKFDSFYFNITSLVPPLLVIPMITIILHSGALSSNIISYTITPLSLFLPPAIVAFIKTKIKKDNFYNNYIHSLLLITIIIWILNPFLFFRTLFAYLCIVVLDKLFPKFSFKYFIILVFFIMLFIYFIRKIFFGAHVIEFNDLLFDIIVGSFFSIFATYIRYRFKGGDILEIFSRGYVVSFTLFVVIYEMAVL